ncbi:unnamed protein product [Brassica napus]|uniref:(rape) hypothetical protein n=1 Tax=Brassica napus TaxID=3708 RepID=A0A816VBR7_BRANA|nr:unnamed protein product [Brassica napus]
MCFGSSWRERLFVRERLLKGRLILETYMFLLVAPLL